MRFADPFGIIVDTAPESMQLELVELRNSEIRGHRGTGLLEFYGALDIGSYPMLRTQALKLMSLFGSTYICEQSFPVMNHNEPHLRSQILGSNIANVLRLAETNIEPQMEKLG